MPAPVAGGVSRFAWTSVKPEQPQKHSSPKLVTELGIVMLVKPEQTEKQDLPKLVTELGIVMLVKPLQPPKHISPKLVTELGIVVFLQPLSIVFVAVSMMALQFSRES